MRFGDIHTGCMGEMLITYFKGRGGAGIVVDGCIRDWPNVQTIGTPLWTRGVTPNYASQATLFPWAYNVPVDLSRVLVLPGDLMIADDDGRGRAGADGGESHCADARTRGLGSLQPHAAVGRRPFEQILSAQRRRSRGI